MSNKIGIVTIYGLYNFGNRLQNYAVYRVFKDLGYESETLVCVKSKTWNIAHNLFRVLHTLRKNPKYLRRTAFYKFVKRTTPIKYIYSADRRIPETVSDSYLCFFSGSDQVWNPEVRVLEKYNYFLRFAPQDKRFSISPSFGVSSIPIRFVNEYKEWLSEFKYLSCREAEGAQIIKELTGRDAEVLIDPTMMLNREQWSQIYEKIETPKIPYILLYFLGDISEKRKSLINRIAEQNNLLVVDVLNGLNFAGLQPDGLLQMIEKSALVCTDSFHLTAFSINFNIPFYVFDRAQENSYGIHMISRIANLLGLFGLVDRLNPTDISKALVCDFTEANETLENERKKEKDFLIKCLEQRNNITEDSSL